MNNMPVVVPSDGRAIDSENLATPDNSHNCEAPNAASMARVSGCAAILADQKNFIGNLACVVLRRAQDPA